MIGTPSDEARDLEHDILEHIGDPIFVKDRDHRWIVINRAFCELVGHTRETLLGRTDHDFFPKEQADFFYAKDREVFETGQTITIEEEPITDAHGRMHILATTKVPVVTNGRVTHLVGIVHDITRLKLELRTAHDALVRKERLTVLGRLSGGVAHQIRNPLAAIRNAAAVLRRKLANVADPEVGQALAIIDEEVVEANRIISDLLDYASIRPPSLADVSVAHLIEDALLRANPPQGLEVKREIDAALMVRVDERQTRDALANVIRNGIDALEAEQGGSLTLRTATDADFVVLTVEDTGPGVADAALLYLFEPLITTKTLGLGLGLATAKALIENQSGKIAYEQCADVGARFVIRLPRAPTE